MDVFKISFLNVCMTMLFSALYYLKLVNHFFSYDVLQEHLSFYSFSLQIMRSLKDVPGVTVGGHSINNLRYANGTVLM